jgi:type I restriction enzyme S subunit
MKRYESYKDSGVEWIGEIPTHWEVSKVKYQFDISGGGTPSTEKDEYWEGTIPWVSSKDMKSRYIYDTIDHITPLGLQNSTCSLVDVGSIIIVVRSGILQRTIPVGINKVPLVVNQDQKVLSSRGDVLEEFFYYFVSGNEISLLTDWMKEGTTVESIEMEYLENFPLHFPPSSEQEQIVSFLDEKTSKIDDLIKKKEQKIELLKEYRTSLINRVITKGLNPDVPMKDSGVEWIGEIPSHWDLPLLSYLISGIKDGTHGTHERNDDGELLLSSKNVSDYGVVIGDNESRISVEEHWSITKNGYPQRNDVLITIVGSIGRSCVYEYDYPISFQRSVCFVRPKNTLNSYFLNYYFKSDCSQYQLVMNTKTSTQGGIYINDIKRLTLIVPPLPEQEQIVSYLDQKTGEIDSTIDSEKKKIDLLKEYRQSLISSVITGKIKVVD